MTDTPKRRFWQIHLSTAVVIMLLSSIILYFALRPQIVDDNSYLGLTWDYFHRESRGWPWTFYECHRFSGTDPNSFGVAVVFDEPNWNLLYALGDLLVAVTLVIMAGRVFEQLIRRRSKQ